MQSPNFDNLTFDNKFLAALRGDPVEGPGIREVAGAWSRVKPTPVAAPRLVAYSREMAQALGLSDADVRSPEFAQVFGGNALLPGMDPFAANYGGHQFGHWAGQLGDGRAILLGEVLDRDGALRDIQLKGAGRTPFSRRGDGSAALGPVLRDALGVPVGVWSASRELPSPNTMRTPTTMRTIQNSKLLRVEFNLRLLNA
jgi:uncharacterized protein YdiU (UPF0061 family)